MKFVEVFIVLVVVSSEEARRRSRVLVFLNFEFGNEVITISHYHGDARCECEMRNTECECGVRDARCEMRATTL